MLTGAMLLILCVWPGFSDYPKHVMSDTPEPPQISTELEIWPGITIDLDTEVSPTELQPGDLTSSNVEPDFSAAEAAGDVSVVFTTSNPLPADGKIVITFPSGFLLNSGSETLMGDDGASFNGATAVSTSGQIVTITRDGDGDSVDAGTIVALELSNIENPSTSGLAGIYSIRTTTASDVIIDEDPEVTPDTFIVGTLRNTNVLPSSLVAGAVGDVGATFEISDPLPADGKIVITFPSGFLLNSGSETLMGDDGASFNGATAVSASGQIVTITRDGRGDSVDAGTVVTLTLTNIKNPPVSGSSKSYIIKTTTSSDITLDIDTAVKPNIITPGVLVSTDVVPASLFAKATGFVSVSFNTANPLPGDGNITVTFPSGFGLIGDEVINLAGDGPSFDGMTAVAISENSVLINRIGGSLVESDTKVFLVLNGVKNPSVPGLTGTYSIKTETSAGVPIDHTTSIPGDVMAKALTPTKSPFSHSSTPDSKSIGESLVESASEDPETVGLALAEAASKDPETVGLRLAVAASEDPESIGLALAVAASEDPESIGLALAEAASEDPESIGLALAEAASEDPDTIGLAIAVAASEDPESIGLTLAVAASEDPENIGLAIAVAASEDPENIGLAIAVAASEDPESIGAAVIYTRQFDKQALGSAVPEILAKNPEDPEVANGVLQQEGLGSVIWVIVGVAGSTGLAILVILFVVLNRNRKNQRELEASR
jgi:RNase P/RNase MRP subunit p29